MSPRPAKPEEARLEAARRWERFLDGAWQDKREREYRRDLDIRSFGPQFILTCQALDTYAQLFGDPPPKEK